MLVVGHDLPHIILCPTFSHKKTRRMFSTMISHRKLSELLPQSMMEATNVLKGISGQATLASVTEFECTLAKKNGQEGNEVANKDWGISVAEEAAIPPDLKSAMMEAVLSVNEVQCLARNNAMKDCSATLLSTECALRMDLDNSAS
jgi:hypothetical protein